MKNCPKCGKNTIVFKRRTGYVRFCSIFENVKAGTCCDFVERDVTPTEGDDVYVPANDQAKPKPAPYRRSF